MNFNSINLFLLFSLIYLKVSHFTLNLDQFANCFDFDEY